MSYQLERDMFDRVSQYHNEAAVRRAVPSSDVRRSIAAALRKMADLIEKRSLGSDFVGEQAAVVLQGRNH